MKTLRLLLLALGFALMPFASSLVAQQPPSETDVLRTELDGIEKTLERRQLTGDDLTGLRERLEPLIGKIDDLSGRLDQRYQTENGKLTQLGGAKLADNAPPETPEAKAEREAQIKTVAALDARIKQVKLLQTRVDQAVDHINDRRRQLFTAQLFERSRSAADPRFWLAIPPALKRAGIALSLLVRESIDHISNTAGLGSLAGALALIALGGFALRFAYRFVLKLAARTSAQAGDTPLRPILRAVSIVMRRTLPIPITVGLAVAALNAFDLLLPRAQPLASMAVIAALIASLSRGVMAGVLSPERAGDRLVQIDDDMAHAIYSAMRDAGLVLGLGLWAITLNSVLVAPVALTAAIATVIALLITAIALIWLARTTREADENFDPLASKLGWLRPVILMVVVGILGALALGYVAFAAFIATRIVAVFLIVTATLLLIRLSDALIAMWFGATTHRGRIMAGALGLKPERVELIGALLSGALRLMFLVISLVLIVAPWGLQSSDITTRLDDAIFGLKLGDLRVSAGNLAAAVVIILIGLMLFRAAKSWFDTKILPRSGMDAGLQNSVSTVMGYVGILVVGTVGLRQLGLDLSNLAIVAGALSLGLGFGLQSIVSNFVSGLILLAERPIRVGDSIAVKGEEGKVKRISVRSTEIETFERATVVIPNSELITGLVKNWTHPNVWTRVILPVRVAYDSDEKLVSSELMAVAEEHPLILKKPGPRVLLLKFGDNGLEFELRAICSDVDQALNVKSDLHFAVLQRFRDKGIIISPPIQRIQTPPEDSEAHLFPNMPGSGGGDQA
jgi:potassium efflux system protein